MDVQIWERGGVNLVDLVLGFLCLAVDLVPVLITTRWVFWIELLVFGY